VGVAFATAACGDDPFDFDWSSQAAPDTVMLYSLDRPEPNLESGYDFRSDVAVRIEAVNATGSWDVAVDTRDGALVLLPPGALGIDSRASIAPTPGVPFADVIEAPSDTAAYVSDAPVTLEMGTVYIVRTHRRPGSFGSRCVYYAKLEPVEIDVAGGTLTFREVTNPICNDRKLIPPD
jgi:hypothetical protein